MQQGKKGTDDLTNATATAHRCAEFDVDNEVTLLNPEVDPVPMPCPDIKVEEEDIEEAVSNESPNNEAIFDSDSGSDPSVPSTSKRELLSETLTNLFSPTSKKPLTRRERSKQGKEFKNETGETLMKKLKEAEKAKRKTTKRE